ncbi:hypothetical protein [Sphingomonas sp. S2M10]|uniref:hypothetical protein n=1 Tax=Sphingomonas sp. S2M10 TaxID=2705010 RepID=UPI0014575A81|nr:hypothetical protein [Sphingomonas sp. S2M10]
MKINWFEGGRRITRLGQILLVLFASAVLLISLPHPTLTLETASPSDPWKLSKTACNYGSDASATTYGVNVGSTLTDVELCFRSSKAEDGRSLVPFAAADKDNWYVDEPYSSAVSAYTEKRKQSFAFPPTLEKEASSSVKAQWWHDFWHQFKAFALSVLIGVGILQALSWVIGWIVRGFLGIPAGKDRKEFVEPD